MNSNLPSQACWGLICPGRPPEVMKFRMLENLSLKDPSANAISKMTNKSVDLIILPRLQH